MLQTLDTVNSRSSGDGNVINTDISVNNFSELIQNYKVMFCDKSRNKNIINAPSTKSISNIITVQTTN